MTTYYFTTDYDIFGEDLIICTNGEQYRVVPTLSNGKDCLCGADLDKAREYVVNNARGWDTTPEEETEFKKLTEGYAKAKDLFDWEDVMIDVACDYPEQIRELDFNPADLENVIVLRVMD